jgi:hypothetical protein
MREIQNRKKVGVAGLQPNTFLHDYLNVLLECRFHVYTINLYQDNPLQ